MESFDASIAWVELFNLNVCSIINGAHQVMEFAKIFKSLVEMIKFDSCEPFNNLKTE